MRSYLLALQFLTIIPLPFRIRCEPADLGRSMGLFPVAGLTIGAALAGADFLLGRVLPPQVTALLLVALLAAVTGVLHLDGLADVCDGLAARGERERFLAVMKDSHVGAAGAAALALALMLKYQALLQLPQEVRLPALLFFPVLGRYALVQMTVGSRRARSDGLGALFVEGAGWGSLLLAGLTTAALGGLLLGITGIACCAGCVLATWGMKHWSHCRIGGVTGDVIGAAGELNEILGLLLMLALSR
jgi:adenosylcobinamide-GDP ribazoletransferase